MKTLRALLAPLLILTLACPAWAGWFIQEKSDDQTSSLYFQDNQVRDQAGEGVTIMNLAQGRLILINPAAKTYWSGPFSDMLKMRDQAMRMMQQQLQQLPPEQRAQAEKSMQEAMGTPNGPAPQVEVKKTGQSAVISGFKAAKYEIYSDGRLREELWIAPRITTAKEMDAKKMRDMMALLAQADADTSYESHPAVLALWEKGYPVKVITHLDGETLERQVIKAQEKNLPASLFSVPPGYRQVELMEMFQ